MAKLIRSSRKALTVARQLAALNAKFPTGEGHIKRGVLTWSLTVKPMAFSLEYLIEVQYRFGTKPDVFASGGEIAAMADLSRIPHKYSIDTERKRVCLCLDYREWSRFDPIATTLVPWAIEWLAHFEVWLTTGTWTGGGIHNGVVEK